MATAEGVFPKVGNDPVYNSEVNSFRNFTFNEIISVGGLIETTAWLHFGGGVVVAANGADGSQRSTDNGETWAAVSTDQANLLDAIVSRGDLTKAFGFNKANNDGATTSDSGDNWTSRTNFSNDNTTCADFPTSTLVVIGTNQSVDTRGIHFSTDSGVNFTECTSGPTINVISISMFDEDTGFAVDDDGNIWYTANAAVDWSDTGHNLLLSTTTSLLTKIIATSTTTYLTQNLFTGNNTASEEVRISATTEPPSISAIGGWLKSDSGNYYQAKYGVSTTSLTKITSLTAESDSILGTFNGPGVPLVATATTLSTIWEYPLKTINFGHSRGFQRFVVE